MVIWSGWGILVVVIAVVVGGSVTAAATMLLTAAGLGSLAGLGFAAGLLAAAAANWWAGRRLNGGPGRVLLDQAAGRTVVLRRTHSLFFIPMQWWSVPLAAAGLIALLASVLNPGGPGAGPAPATGERPTRTL